MPDTRRAPVSAADVVTVAEASIPGAVELAALLPQAARLERALLRDVRLMVLPHLRVADEVELWTSSLVEVRGMDGLVLRADVLELLRLRARIHLTEGGEQADRLRLANDRLVAHHAGSPPLVRLEEEIAWLAMSSATAVDQIEERLEVALAALVRDGRVGVARWAARALPRLPDVAKTTRAAWQLSHAAADRLRGSGPDLGVGRRPGTSVIDLAALAPHLGSAPLGVRRLGDRLELGAVGPGGTAILVPSTEPRFVLLLDASATEPTELAIPAATRQQVDVGWDTLTMRSAAGDEWVVPVHTEDEQRWLFGVTLDVMDAEAPDEPLRQRWLATAVAPGVGLTAVPPGATDHAIALWTGERIEQADLPDLRTGLSTSSDVRLITLEPWWEGVRLLPLATAVPDGARVVSFGVDPDGERLPVVGTWSDVPDHGTVVHARTRAPADGCLGAPIVIEGQLAGVVHEAIAEAPGPLHELLLLVTSRGLDEVVHAAQPRVPQGASEPAPGGVTIDLLPAGHGQAVLVSWGPPTERRHLLVDGGPRARSKDLIRRVMARTQGSLELVVVTHGDADKVDGIAQLLEEPGSIGDVWFNGPRELSSSFGVALSPSAAVDRLMAALSSRAAPVNTAFGGRPVVVDPSGPFPRVQLPGGATVTVLGPSRKQLAALRKAWNDRGKRRPFEPVDAPERVVAEDEATTPEQLEEVPVRAPQGTSETEPRVRRRVRFGSDRAPANGSSIVVLFEHEQRSVLLPGDAHAGPLLDAVRRLAVERGVAGLFVDVFVLPHGGSSGNVTPELLRLLEAGTYAVCSSGAYFRHPDPETIELIAHERPGSAIAFNYRSKVTERWADPAIAERYGLRTHFPEPGHDGIVLTLEPTAVSH